ncbi:MAG: type 1 glutamine amidotransferase [Phycisphaeraceae bacterium]|nr:MAG: type 1 glutamine amidotransferase [Phycisphaeraceae bacterium]
MSYSLPMAIIVFQHSDIGRPGRLGTTLRDHGFRIDVRRPDWGGAIPADLDDVEAVISLGGPQSAAESADRPDWMQAELDCLRAAHEAELPVIGVCLGAQLLAAALGGEVARMDKPELGFHPIDINPSGHTDTALTGVSWSAQHFCHHHDHVARLPDGAMALASSKKCPVQIFRAGIRSYGFQQHFEADQAIIGDLLRNTKPDDLAAAGLSESEQQVQMDAHYANFARLSNRLCVNLASFIIPAGRQVIRW